MATEKRLIDANALEFIPDSDCVANGVLIWGGRGGKTMTTVLAALKKMVDNAPTVDAVEVVHGRWINPYMNRYGHPCHCCSVCGFKASYQDKNYCPNCGAKMDL